MGGGGAPTIAIARRRAQLAGRTAADPHRVRDTIRVRAAGASNGRGQRPAERVLARNRLDGDKLTGMHRLQQGLQLSRVNRLGLTGDFTRLH